uniref:Uncharacterized protein LOC8281932 isoform X2 n=1 Tax=Rhizophora mucronata TaxID=61149 RepID=A0A2P2J983_RHIMU
MNLYKLTTTNKPEQASGIGGGQGRMQGNSSSLLLIASGTNCLSSLSLVAAQHVVKSPSSVTSHLTLRLKNHFFRPSPPQQGHTHFSFHPLPPQRFNPFPVYVQNKRGKGGVSAAVEEMSDFEEDELDGEDEDDFEEEDYDDNDDDEKEVEKEEFVPFGRMKRWFENKPAGFGEGKVYDTSIEDKLLDEIEQSRKAQAANLNNLKNNRVKPATKKGEHKKKKVPEVIPGGIRVHVFNLPKKKNIHRDLKSAFKEVPGIVDIFPAVSGNKKTRDPICKGFAFVDFMSEVDAARFVQVFSGQSITFGKIQKDIKCKMINSSSSNISANESVGCFESAPHVTHCTLEEDGIDGSSFEETALHMYDDLNDDDGHDDDDNNDGAFMTSNLEHLTIDVESFGTPQLKDGDSMDSMVKSMTSSLSLKKKHKFQANKKKSNTKGREGKDPKLEVPGSAKRLKIKEKAVLTQVFSKYALQAASASREER